LDSHRFSALRQVVDGALALPADQRPSFVKTQCAGDGELERQALALLAHEKTKGPALTGVFENQVRLAATSALQDEPLPGPIGDYEIVGKLGEGGMGVVFRAEQSGALERTVALKLIRAGWSSQRVIARFESERLTLARMDHPNIARVFDAGTSSDGRPWFAMELVEGKPLTVWCEEHGLDTRERLDLFTRVCRGVQHAHQKGIIHRDLKPSNVMVTGSYGAPVPKIIDFGIAKALTDEQDLRATLTLAGQQFGSPDYMSPEHTGGEDDVDIRTDVYSLGILLYEVLTGDLPAETPTQRARENGRSRSSLKGELDWVVGKAMAPERDNRYATAHELMQDLERYLAGEPVLAGRPSMTYRLGKFVRRHRVPVTITAVVVVSLALGLAESQRQRHRADAARDQAELMTVFLSDMLSSVRPEEEGREVTVRQVLDKAAAGVGEDFADRPLVQARLQTTIGLAYTALGENDEAIAQLEETLAIRRREQGDQAPETLMAMCNLGQAVSRAGRFDEAGTLYREALEGFRNDPGAQIAEVCRSMNGLANALSDQGLLDEAEPYYLEALEAARTHLGEDDPQTCSLLNNLAILRADQGRMAESREILAEVLERYRRIHGPDHPKTMEVTVSLASVDSHLDEFDRAVAALEPLVPLAQKKLGEGHRITLTAMNNLAWVYARTGRFEDAEPLMRETLEVRQRELGRDHLETLISAFNLADLLKRKGSLAESENLHRETLAARKRVLGDEHHHTRLSATTLAEFLREQGRDAGADSLLSANGLVSPSH
jgi:non-specific serine/threonine protein kinase/serine/threonine-protein kinase